ncbi:putative double-stranded RNA-binding domain-containing protein [Rosa chinensis]|uniref:Putative double-stranded RNA-binding domain-containing protein n=1 Tax=Rosa chinensis TaxID=74649 RepID=A0A2P6R6B9_ROSCH|nr:putative double-stranded RNA-binding domain-containing protein [Rosa chinensis]
MLWDMYKNRLQEEAQKRSLNFPSYSSTRERPDHAPRFKATVNFDGKTYESPDFYRTLREAENAAAEVALNKGKKGGHKAAVLVSSKNRSAYMFKNRLQEKAQKSRLKFPSYSHTRKGPDHDPLFKATVNFDGKTFESPTFSPTLREAENAAAEVALNTVEKRGHKLALAAVLAVLFIFLHAWLYPESTREP